MQAHFSLLGKKCIGHGGGYVEKWVLVAENMIYQIVFAFFVSAVVSMEINRWCYFQSHLCIIMVITFILLKCANA